MSLLLDAPPSDMLALPEPGDPALQTLTDLPAVELDDLTRHGALMTRVDRKYLVDLDVVPALLGALPPDTRVLEIGQRRVFDYRSVYFDTPDLVSYLMAARRRRRRFKVRTRTYLDSGASWLEVKTRDGRGRTVKTRIPWHEGMPGLRRDGRAFVAEALAGTLSGTLGDPADLVDLLGPVLSTTYRRATLLLPEREVRVTIDTGLAGSRGLGPGLLLPHLAIVETKTLGPACPVDRALWALGQRPVRVSKYATLLAALDPGLPAHRWLPALRRIVAGAVPAPAR